LGHEWVPERTPEGAKRSAAVEAKRRLVRAGSRGTIDPERGKLIKCLGWNGAKRNEDEAFEERVSGRAKPTAIDRTVLNRRGLGQIKG